jgi:dihydrodipicolinate synthase/N-acetylneuraminate lyase
VVRIYDDFERGDLEAARLHQDALIELVGALRTGVFPAGIKAALHMQGICEPWPAPPTAPLDEASTARLRQRLEAWGLLSKPPD